MKADLFAKRKQRTSRERLFQQTNRHELTVQGGYYVSDLFDGTYTVGGAYTYHMTEDLAVEASGSYTRLTSSGGPELERTFAVLQGKPRGELYFDADLIWVPAHAKMRLGGSITHFDLYLALGGGIVDSVLSEDLAGNGGFGLKFFLGHASPSASTCATTSSGSSCSAGDAGQRPDHHGRREHLRPVHGVKTMKHPRLLSLAARVCRCVVADA